MLDACHPPKNNPGETKASSVSVLSSPYLYIGKSMFHPLHCMIHPVAATRSMAPQLRVPAFQSSLSIPKLFFPIQMKANCFFQPFHCSWHSKPSTIWRTSETPSVPQKLFNLVHVYTVPDVMTCSPPLFLYRIRFTVSYSFIGNPIALNWD